MNMTDNVDAIFPFSKQPTEEIGRGVEFRVLRQGDGWVVKEGINDAVNTFDQLREDKKDYEIFRRYIPSFLPETQHIRGHTTNSKEGNIIRQREIKGKQLWEVPNEKITNDTIKPQLIELLSACERMWEQEGRMIDFYGMKNMGLKSFSPRFARNIMIEDGTNKVWLVDTAANKLGFSKESALKYQIPLTLLRFGIKTFLKKLQDK